PNPPGERVLREGVLMRTAGYHLAVRAIRQQLGPRLDLIIHLERMEDGTRRVTAITEVQRMESEVITLQEIFAFKIQQVLPDRTVVGSMQPTGLRPTFLYKFEKRGISLPNDLFAVPGALENAEFPVRAGVS